MGNGRLLTWQRSGTSGVDHGGKRVLSADDFHKLGGEENVGDVVDRTRLLVTDRGDLDVAGPVVVLRRAKSVLRRCIRARICICSSSGSRFRTGPPAREKNHDP